MTSGHDVYEGYFIPKGRGETCSSKTCVLTRSILDTIVFANIWCVGMGDVCGFRS